MSTAKFNTWQNPDGTENYKCRAWVNFNGTGTVAIRASGGVSSIIDNAVGDYTVNFTTAMPDANYCGVVTGGSDALSATFGYEQNGASGRTLATNSSYRVAVATNAGTAIDRASINVAIFR